MLFKYIHLYFNCRRLCFFFKFSCKYISYFLSSWMPIDDLLSDFFLAEGEPFIFYWLKKLIFQVKYFLCLALYTLISMFSLLNWYKSSLSLYFICNWSVWLGDFVMVANKLVFTQGAALSRVLCLNTWLQVESIYCSKTGITWNNQISPSFYVGVSIEK